MRLSVALNLGRISNLPTVWTNVMVGAILSGAGFADARVPLLAATLSLFYVAGMFLNDAFDREFDARVRPDRPIPSGQASVQEVFGFGFGMLAAGILIVAWIGLRMAPGKGSMAILPALGLAGAIVLYDVWHKSNPISPLIMGVCRMLVYVCAAMAIAGQIVGTVLIAASVLLCYLIGLTYAAKQEHLARIGSLWPLAFLGVPVIYGAGLASSTLSALPFLVAFVLWTAWGLRLLRRRGPGDVPRAVISLIAGISLLDAIILAGHGATGAALLCIAAFGLTLGLQRWVTGT